MSEQLPEPGSVEPPKEAVASAAGDAKPGKTRRPYGVEIPAPPGSRSSSLEKKLTDLYITLGTGIVMFDSTCGTTIIAQAPETAAALDTLAKENPKVKRALERLVAGGAWGAVVTAHFPILATLAAHHNMLPAFVAEQLGITPKAKPTLRVDPESNGETSGVGERAATT